MGVLSGGTMLSFYEAATLASGKVSAATDSEAVQAPEPFWNCMDPPNRNLSKQTWIKDKGFTGLRCDIGRGNAKGLKRLVDFCIKPRPAARC